MKSARLSAPFALIALLLSCLSGCTTLDSEQWNERAALCDQDRIDVPDWPRSEFEAYAIELLGVLADDRMRTQVERDCRADL